MRTLSADALRGVLAQHTDEVYLVCLTIDHADLASPLLLVNDRQSLARTAGTFEPFGFDARLPDEVEESVPQVQLTFDNVDRSIVQAIRELGGDRPSCTMEVVTAGAPNTIEVGPFAFSILSIDYDAGQVRAILGYEEDPLNSAFPAGSFTPVNSPGLFS